MKEKTALVLSGGASRGAFQFAAEKYAREEKGYTWDIITGVSVGALNGSMLAQEKYKVLEDTWNNISNDKIYTGKLNLWTFVKFIFGKKSIYSNDPLKRLIEKHVNPDDMKIKFRVGVVSLETGEYDFFSPDMENFKKAVLASTIMPIIWEPIDISEKLTNMLDGGVRNISPLSDVLDDDPDEMIIINCSPTKPYPTKKPMKNILNIGLRSIDILMNEIISTDVREFLRINSLVKQAEEKGYSLLKEDGKPYKYFENKIIEPNEPLGDQLDFSKESIQKRIQLGIQKAREILG